MTIDEKTEVPASVLGSALGLSRKRVEQLTNEGVIPRAAKGRFPLLAGIAGYVSWLKADQRQANKSAAANRLHEERAEEVRVRTLERKKTLQIEAQREALHVIDEFAGQLRADLMAIPARVSDDLALRRSIEDKIDAAFGEASKRAAAAADLVEGTARSPGDRGGFRHRRRL